MDVYLGSMFLVPYNFAPVNFAFCQGQLLPISRYTALFSLLGTYYGGDGKTTFALPNLQGSVAIGYGNGPGLQPHSIGEQSGVSTVTLSTQTVPPHNHMVVGSRAGATVKNPNGASLATITASEQPIYTQNATNLVTMQSLNPLGNGLPHNNLMPFLTLNWIICLNGAFPPRS